MLDPLPQNEWSKRHADHLLHRAGFGGSPEEREAFFELGKDQGVAGAVDSLLEENEDWSSIPLPGWVFDEDDPNGDLVTGQGQRRRILTEWYFNCLKNGQALTGKTLKFLVDHLPIDSATSNQYTRFIYLFRYFETLRHHAAGDVDSSGRYGDFKTLAKDISWNEAMMRMLDLQTSNAGNVNENFGRELLELFTLGVDGGYTEDDVGAAAAAFTGRKLYNYQSPHPNAPTLNPNSFAPPGEPVAGSYQNTNRQDLSAKTFLGQTQMPGGGDIVTGDDIIELIFLDPNCGRHLCWKLWRYFVAPDPSDDLLNALAAKFRDTHDYKLRPMLREIFLSQEFYDAANVGHHIKDAADFLLVLFKQLEIPLPQEYPVEFLGNALGYNVLFPPSIAGWPEPESEGNEWLSAGAMVFRMNSASIWTHRNYELMNGRTRVQMIDYPDIDWDKIAPASLRSPENFPLLVEKLNTRLLPFHKLRKSQVRTLYGRYGQINEKIGPLEATKEMVRLMLALPEYQMQ